MNIALNFESVEELLAFVRAFDSPSPSGEIVEAASNPQGHFHTSVSQSTENPSHSFSVNRAKINQPHTHIDAPEHLPVTPAPHSTAEVAPVPAAAIPKAPASTIPTTAVSYTIDDLARAAMTLMDSGRQGELQKLLAGFGVEALPQLPQAQYGAFATQLRERGAKI